MQKHLQAPRVLRHEKTIHAGCNLNSVVASQGARIAIRRGAYEISLRLGYMHSRRREDA